MIILLYTNKKQSIWESSVLNVLVFIFVLSFRDKCFTFGDKKRKVSPLLCFALLPKEEKAIKIKGIEKLKNV